MNTELDGAGLDHGGQRPTPQFRMPTTEPQQAPLPDQIRWTQSAEAHRERIAVVAYHLSAARGFAPGHDVEDWLLAQAQIDAEDAASFER